MKNEKKPKSKMNTLDKYLIFCFAVIIIYTIAHSYIFYKTGVEAVTLTVAVYSLFGEELILLFLIKRHKLQDIFKMLKDKKDSDF